MKSLIHSLSFFFFFIWCNFGPNVVLSSSIEERRRFSQLELARVLGPESIAFDCHGEGPYVGVSDGRILKWRGPRLGWSQFAITSPNRKMKECDGSINPKTEPICGRPLGLKFNNATCELYIADAYFGLLKVGPQGGLAKQLASSADGVPLHFTNALDIDTISGAVYFTDSSILFQRRVWLLSIVNGDKTGRLLKYDPKAKKVTVLLKDLAFPNGVALSKDNAFLLLAETGTLQILKVWLKGPKSHTTQTFVQLQRFPDNIKSNSNGEFWVALNSGRGQLQKIGVEKSEDGNGIPWLTKDPVAAKFDENGMVKRVLDGENGNDLESVSEVEEYNGRLWIGSAVKPFVGIIKV